jgi:hypothetical protein
MSQSCRGAGRSGLIDGSCYDEAILNAGSISVPGMSTRFMTSAIINGFCMLVRSSVLPCYRSAAFDNRAEAEAGRAAIEVRHAQLAEFQEGLGIEIES